MPRWGMFKKLSLERTEDRLKAFILICGVILALFLGSAGVIRQIMSPAFCAKCHVMAPEYSTWEASSHMNIACTKCHIKPGIVNLVIHKPSAMKELYLYYTGTYDRPIKMDHKLDDAICIQCHSPNRDFTPAGDLIIPHDKHAAKKVQCIDCHSGVAHGNILGRKLTEDGNYAAWTQELGKQQMVKDYTEPKMNTCLECHIKRQVTQACEACHTTISLPPDHKVKDWGISHGHLAKGDLEYCNKCHSYSIEAKDIPVKDPLARYARGNVFCYDCHQKRPLGHTDDWRMIHKKDVKNGDVSGCLVCHGNQKPTPKEKTVPTYCAKCHGQKSDSSGQTSGTAKQGIGNSSTGQNNNGFGQTGKLGKVHQSGWRKIHPGVVKEKGATNEGCWDCHDTTQCSRCHLNKL